MSNKPPVIVVDADAIVAQAHPQDANHKKALDDVKILKDLNAQIIYPSTAVCEAVTVLQHKLKKSATAYGTAVVFTDPNLEVVEINQETIRRAVNHFSPTTSKKNTLFDCIVLDTAEKYKADAIFSFDHFYESRGFKLVGELKKA